MPNIDENAILLHFEIIGDRPKYHIFARNHATTEGKNVWLTKEEVIKFVKEYNEKGFTVWVSFNEVEEGKDSIEGVSAIFDLWFDIDPEREDKSKPATKEEKEDALKRAIKLKGYIEHEYKAMGFMASSGNGFHIHFPLPRYPLVGAKFRREVNAKVTAFAKRVSANAGVEIDHTYDIRRVSTVIGSLNLKIPTEPLETKWEKSLAELPFDKAVETIKTARKANQRLLEAIMDESTEPQEAHIVDDGAEFTADEDKRLNDLRLQDEKLDTLLDGVWKGYKSRSEAEFALVIKLISYGFSKKQIFFIMEEKSKLKKWSESNPSYRELTFKKATRFIQKGGQRVTVEQQPVENQPETPIENPLNEGEDPLEVLIAPVRRKVLLEPAISSIILAGFSAYTGTPMNTIVLKKKTAEGGTYTLKNTLDIFPPEDVLFLDSVSPTSFFHERTTGYMNKDTNEDITQRIEELRVRIENLKKNENAKAEREMAERELKGLLKNAVSTVDLSHKVIAFSEPQNSELFSKLKSLLSGDREYFDIKFTNKNSAGAFKTESVRIIGHPVFFVVLSEDEIKNSKLGIITDPQLASRFFKVEINIDQRKFKAGKNLMAAMAALPDVFGDEYKAELEKARQLIRYLRQKIIAMKVNRDDITANPFAPELAQLTPSEEGEDMRTFQFLLALVENRTLLNMDNRLHLVRGAEEVVVSCLSDVTSILETHGTEIISHMPPSKAAEFNKLKELLGEKALGSDEIYDSGIFSYESENSLRTHLLNPLVKYGYLNTMVDPQDPRHRRLLYQVEKIKNLQKKLPENENFNDTTPFGVKGVITQKIAHETKNFNDTTPFGVIGVIKNRFIMKWVSAGYQICVKNCDKKIFSVNDLDNLIKKYVFCDFSVSLNKDNETSVEFLMTPMTPNDTKVVVSLKSVKLSTETTTLTRQTQNAQHETHEPEQKRAETTIAAPIKEPEEHVETATPMKQETNTETKPVKAQTEGQAEGRTETDRYIASASPLPQERALGNFVIISYSNGETEYECARCGSRFNTIEAAARHKEDGCVQKPKPKQAAHKPVTAPAPEPTIQNAPTTEQISTPTQATQASTETHGAEKNGEQSAAQSVAQSAAQKEFEEKLRAKIANGKPACADGEPMKYDVVASNHGKCTGFYAQDGALPELVKYGNKLYILYCEDGAVAFVCSVCRIGFTTLQSFEKHAKEKHGWEFG